MREQKVMNNKGFSLVELIIVIAIMAILVGVLSPQLIRYVEKANVAADIQMADGVRSAITFAMMDPSVINATDSSASMIATIAATGTAGTALSYLNGTDTVFQEAVWETIGGGITDQASLLTQVRSARAAGGGITVAIPNSNSVSITIDGTDADGKKDTASGTPIVVQ